MSTTLKAPRTCPSPHADAEPAVSPSKLYRSDVWALWFWLGCAGFLILILIVGPLECAFRSLFGR